MGFIINNQDQLLRRPQFDFKLIEEVGITYIEEQKSIKKGNEASTYEPLTYKENYKMPHSPNENLLDSPYVALANLNFDNSEEVLSFVKTWGLLGLHKVKYFEEVSFEEKKEIQLVDLFRSNNGKKREPLFLIQRAIKHYQSLIKLIDKWQQFKKNLITISDEEKIHLHAEIKANINHIIQYNPSKVTSTVDYNEFEISTFANTLYGSIYGITAEDLAKGTGLQICANQNCKAYFRPTRSDRIYCSTQCNDAVRQRYMRIKRKTIAAICKENPALSKDEITKIIKGITKDKYLTEQEIKEQFYIKQDQRLE